MIGEAWARAGWWYRMREEEGWRGQGGKGIKLASERGEVVGGTEGGRWWRVSAWQEEEAAAAECQDSWAEGGSSKVVMGGVRYVQYVQ